MSEFRQDRTTGFWTVVAPGRSERPLEAAPGSTAAAPRPSFDPECPFCPGNEAMLAAIVEQTDGPDAPGWRVRTVPNKFPILSGGGHVPADPLEAGYGHHEVIIETPRHDADLPDLPPEHIRAVIETWRSRFAAALALPGIETVALFRNRGSAAGASLGHAHSQLIALPFTPPRLERSLAWACAWHDGHGECATCAELRREAAASERVIELTEEFAMLVPFATRGPLEQWIVPRRHQPFFLQADAAQRAALGGVLQRALRRMKSLAGDTAYELLVEPGSPHASHGPAAHWSLRIMPSLVKPGGFEKLCDIAVAPSSPEEDARRLRAAN